MSLEFKANLSYILYAISRGYIGRACLKKQKKMQFSTAEYSEYPLN